MSDVWQEWNVHGAQTSLSPGSVNPEWKKKLQSKNMSALKISNGVDPEWKKDHERWVHFNLAMGKKGHKKLFRLEKNLLNSVNFISFKHQNFALFSTLMAMLNPIGKYLFVGQKN